MKVKLSEKDVQIQFVEWFKLQYPHILILSIPNEATWKNAGLRKMGVLQGVFDIMIIFPAAPYHVLFIEFKVGYNKLRPSQRQFQEQVEAAQCATAVCYSADEAMAVFRTYCNGQYERRK